MNGTEKDDCQQECEQCESDFFHREAPFIFRLLYVNDSSFFECCDKSHNSRISQAETVSVYKYVRSSDDKTYDEKGDSEYQSNDTPGQL